MIADRIFTEAVGRAGLQRAGARAARRFFLAGIVAGSVCPMGSDEQRGRLDHSGVYGAYIVAVPVLVTLTDRVEAKSVYLAGVGMTVVGHLLFGLYADGFWSAMAARALTGAGWAETYMTGLKLLADRVEGRLLSRATAEATPRASVSPVRCPLLVRISSRASADGARRSLWRASLPPSRRCSSAARRRVAADLGA